ncbi:Fatty acid synthase [Fragariocoptes setiger]|uniref:Fatty acid synthase n=1 Tax=Fragariocoptes setiger TaxID=1670756 RepID=A0ABQ7S8S9_9ACAR|nr:Fatty acid synthase [Fragariocoptes setiger]
MNDKQTLQELADYYNRNLEPVDVPDTGYVISGIAGRFPSADNIDELWDNFLNGRDMVTGPDDKRWPLGLWGLPERAARIKDITKFDNEFFGVSKESADYVDHQLRCLYEVVYESIMDAGINPSELRGDTRTGFYLGFHTNEIDSEFNDRPHRKNTGYQGQLMSQVTDYFDIRGASGSFDAACASSFAAFHQAVVALRAATIERAIVAGVNIPVKPTTTLQFLVLKMLSPTGSSKFLDANADGYARTEACVSIVLQSKHVARRNYCSIIHTKCNNDGFKIEGITYPKSTAQIRLMEEATSEAGIDPNQVMYVEAHGTGTPAGDPEEARAIAQVFCQNRQAPLLVGSVKSNLGHAEGASGMCSLAKAICTLEHELLPRNLHYNKPNPLIEPLMSGLIRPVTENIPYKHNILPINCYGFGGVNVHGIFRSNPKRINRQQQIAPVYPRLMLMFGRTHNAIDHIFDRFKSQPNNSSMIEPNAYRTADFVALIDSISQVPVDRLMQYRGYLLLDNEFNELARDITSLDTCDSSTNLQQQHSVKSHFQDYKRPIWYVLPGLGSQWKQMALNLAQFEPFWSTMERLARCLAPHGLDLIDIVTSDKETTFEPVTHLFTGVVSMQIALLNLLTQLNVTPDGIIGHSVGEISCAYADGLLSEDETIQLAYQLGKCIDDEHLYNGSMVVCSMSAAKAQEFIGSQRNVFRHIELACINGPESVTLSRLHWLSDNETHSNDKDEENKALYDALRANVGHAGGPPHRLADIRTPFHHSQLKQIKHRVSHLLDKTIFKSRQTLLRTQRWHSTSSSSTSRLVNGAYYANNISSVVNFNDTVSASIPCDAVIVEIGPHGLFEPVIRSMVTMERVSYVSLLSRRQGGTVESLLCNLGRLYRAGVPVKVSSLYPKFEYPVGKGTPSVSSLWQWNHERSFHVARFPESFRNSPCEIRIKFDLADNSDRYLADHCLDGRVLFPATGYLYLVIRALTLSKDQMSTSDHTLDSDNLDAVEFRDVRLHRATMLGSTPVELLIRLEMATGQFEIRESNSVVVDGFARILAPDQTQLQYQDLLDNEQQGNNNNNNPPMILKSDDIYKSLRTCGYDYGPSFRHIIEASDDGLHIRIRHAGKFVAFADCLLQAMTLTWARRGEALFLPTKFEYCRIVPRWIKKKYDEAQAQAQTRGEPVECVFECRSQPETGIIVTHGMEMKGVSATPVPRRAQQEPLLECYQFVRDFEHEVDDRIGAANDLLSKRHVKQVSEYERMCWTLLHKITSAANGTQSMALEWRMAHNRAQLAMNGYTLVGDKQLSDYLEQNSSNEQHVMLRLLQKIANFKMDDKMATTNGQLKAPAKSSHSNSALNSNSKLTVTLNQCELDTNSSENEKTQGENENCVCPLKEKVKENGQHNGKQIDLRSIDSNKAKANGQSITQSNGNLKAQKKKEANVQAKAKREIITVANVTEEPKTRPNLRKQTGTQIHSRKEKEKSNEIEEEKEQVLTIVNNSHPLTEMSIEQKLVQEFQLCQQSMCQDIVTSGFLRERLLRPTVEMIFENIHCDCTAGQKVKMLEINSGYSLKYEPVATLTRDLFKNVAIDYTLYHPDSKGVSKKCVPQDAKLFNWNPDSRSLGYDLQNLDVIVYTDASCYAHKRNQWLNGKHEQHSMLDNTHDVNDMPIDRGDDSANTMHIDNLNVIIRNIAEALSVGGFLLTFARTKLTRIEQYMYQLAECELDGQDEARFKQIVESAQQAGLRLLSQRCDTFGCTVALFRKIDPALIIGEQQFITINHDCYDEWVLLLKRALSHTDESLSNNNNHANDAASAADEDVLRKRNVWLLSSQELHNGIVGMVQCLRKEPGGERIRFIYDPHGTISKRELVETIVEYEQQQQQQQEVSSSNNGNMNDKTSTSTKEAESDRKKATVVSERRVVSKIVVDGSQLQQLVSNDLVFNCFDSGGQRGAYRHFTINQFIDEQRVKTDEAYVNVATRGDLSSFNWYEAPYKYLPAEYRHSRKWCSIYYSSLNFRDIMLATGRLPLDAIPISIALSDCLLGLEFAGITGDGKRVAGMVAGRAIGTAIALNDDEHLKFAVPKWMSLEEAATIPVAYLTAIMALVYRGKVQRGESILIHAGSGGVGQAAIRLALHYGLRVYTTVGTPEKRDFIRQQFAPHIADEHIFSSRDCTFEEGIMRATGGRGVDLVLNSLAEDKLQASIRCLADGGRFLEIGKYDMALNNALQLHALDTNKTVHGILLDKLFELECLTPTLRRCKHDMIALIEHGIRQRFVCPIKRTVFERHQMEQAFRFMATGKHIGKVLIKIRDEPTLEVAHHGVATQKTSYDTPDCSTVANSSTGAATTTTNRHTNSGPQDNGTHKRNNAQLASCRRVLKVSAIARAQFDHNRVYIVTGGLGGFGLELTKWLFENGARRLVLTSRSGIRTGYQQLIVDRLQLLGARIHIFRVDDSCGDDDDNSRVNSNDAMAQQLVSEALRLGPLGGCFNLAMVLRDAMFENMTHKQFVTVCEPKCAQVVALDRAIRVASHNDPHCLFVCFSSVSCAKGNAGQANYGYANSVMERVCEARRRDALHALAIQWGAIGDVGVAYELLGGNDAVVGGTVPQRMPSCFATLSKLLACPFAVCLSVLQADKRSLGGAGAGGIHRGDLVKTILHVLGIKNAASVDPSTTLGELGLDSLMAVEIRQALVREYDVALTVQEIRSLTITKIKTIQEGNIKDNVEAAIKAANANHQKATTTTSRTTDETIKLNQANGSAHNDNRPTTNGNSNKDNVKASLTNNGNNNTFNSKKIPHVAPPPLCLPKQDLVWLNQVRSRRPDWTLETLIKSLQSSTHTRLDVNDWPIFVLPPMNGDFARLVPLTNCISRPCIGINWTTRMARIDNAQDSARAHLDVIRLHFPTVHTIDLIGYSFGAAMAYELMTYIQRHSAEAALQCGRLIMLDGAPQQINAGLQIVMQQVKKRDKQEQVSALIAAYLTQHHTFEYLALYEQIHEHTNWYEKLSFASRLLAQRLSMRQPSDIVDLALAIEAYCRRFQLMLDYRVSSSFKGDVTLIRASTIYMGNKNDMIDDDYGLSKQ